MKKIKFIHIILVIAIIVMIILGYVLISKNKIIQDQEKEIELKTMEENGSNSYILTSDHFDQTVKVWNKTYAYDDYTWEGATLKTTGYTALTTSSKDSIITVNLEDSDVIDVSRIQGWTIRFWTSASTSSTENDGNAFRSARATSGYWFEYPVLNAVYDPDLNINMSEGNFPNDGKIVKKGTEFITGIDGVVTKEVDLQEIKSMWLRKRSNTNGYVAGLNGELNFAYDSTLKTMKFSFEYINHNIFAVKGYPVMDVTIYYI